MTGKELIEWIQENKAEDMEIMVCYEPYVGDYDEPAIEIRDGKVYML